MHGPWLQAPQPQIMQPFADRALMHRNVPAARNLGLQVEATPAHDLMNRRVRGIVKTRINTALNRIVSLHAPAEIVVERLDFRMPGLSRRLNRIISNCGRAVFRAKLADLKDRFGVEAAEINPAYTSQECSRCGFVSRENRLSQSRFRCVQCGHTAHADVDGAKVITARRSRGLDFRFTARGQVLAELQRRFGERRRRHHDDVPRGTKASSRQPIPHGQSPPGRTEIRLSHESQ